jgi:ribosomal protein S21
LHPALRLRPCSAKISSVMIQVTRKDPQEANENLIRRFNRKVQQSGILTKVKDLQYFAKPVSKTERRKRAIVRKARKADKLKRIRLGIR